MTCENCLYNKNCQFLLKHKAIDVNGCTAFEDKSEWVHLPYKPLPLLKDGDPSNTDVYCPSCMEDLSGYYIGGSSLNMVVCFNCGEIINITESITMKEAEKALKDIRKASSGGKIID